MVEPVVSIIIPVYNVEPYVRECIESVMAQTSTERMECLIVDDCGTDESMDVVRAIIKDYHGHIEFKIITRLENGGLSAARNTGIKEARGKYLYFLDSDDVITPDALESLLDVANRWPQAQIITGKLETFPITSNYCPLKNVNEDKFIIGKTEVRKCFLSTFPVVACNKLVLRDFLLSHEIIFREGIIHEDDDWQARAYSYIECIAICSNITYHYRKREGSITSNPRSIKAFDSLIITAREVLSSAKEWDNPWVLWTNGTMITLKLKSLQEPSNIKYRTSEIRSLITTILKNKDIPISLRPLIWQYKFKKPLLNPLWSYRYIKFFNKLGFYKIK